MFTQKLRYLLILVLLLTALSTTSPHVQAQSIPADVQGEIAYVLDGDIWLMDLVSGETEQLTDDGNNQWPIWSPDGRYLLL